MSLLCIWSSVVALGGGLPVKNEKGVDTALVMNRAASSTKVGGLRMGIELSKYVFSFQAVDVAGVEGYAGSVVNATEISPEVGE